MTLEEAIRMGENGDPEAIISLAKYYMDHMRDKDVETDTVLYWNEKAAELKVYFAILLSASLRELGAFFTVKYAQENNLADRAHFLEEAIKEWRLAIKWRRLQLECIDAGHPANVEPEERESAEAELRKNQYQLALCYFELDDYATAVAALQGLNDTKSLVLSAVCAIQMKRGGTEQEIIAAFEGAYKRLALIEQDSAYSAMEKTDTEEFIYYLAAMDLSAIYRLGAPGVAPNLRLSVQVLTNACRVIKGEIYTQSLQKELRHYRQNLFGGYKYVD